MLMSTAVATGVYFQMHVMMSLCSMLQQQMIVLPNNNSCHTKNEFLTLPLNHNTFTPYNASDPDIAFC
jgi:hypothetical protein